ncbi:hypothetical protein I0882_001412 [Salmonella enterica]|nr:hypothetical protein [Salmonella enterica]EGP9273709.1 hypothetical protein [Salmonella enterica]EHT8757824.1 hypothetical protein [Salmonella enterica]
MQMKNLFELVGRFVQHELEGQWGIHLAGRQKCIFRSRQLKIVIVPCFHPGEGFRYGLFRETAQTAAPAAVVQRVPGIPQPDEITLLTQN